uniref:Expressed conserved protein n=1 Tax=Echinococcus granulosus TaxID=6210 RepID=A0A068X4U2_ECHGR|nr:hypothetical protein EgrG_002054800 [Echinococcus granulosus]
MPLLVSLRQYLCLIIILYVTSIRGFRLDPEALLKTGYSHGTLLAIGASLGLLAVVTFVTISCCIKKDSSVKYIIDSDLSSSISDFTESSSFPSPQLQASMPIPDSLYIILNECYTHRHPFLDDSAILVAPDVLGNPLSPHISDLLFQCP